MGAEMGPDLRRNDLLDSLEVMHDAYQASNQAIAALQDRAIQLETELRHRGIPIPDAVEDSRGEIARVLKQKTLTIAEKDLLREFYEGKGYADETYFQRLISALIKAPIQTGVRPEGERYWHSGNIINRLNKFLSEKNAGIRIISTKIESTRYLIEYPDSKRKAYYAIVRTSNLVNTHTLPQSLHMPQVPDELCHKLEEQSVLVETLRNKAALDLARAQSGDILPSPADQEEIIRQINVFGFETNECNYWNTIFLRLIHLPIGHTIRLNEVQNLNGPSMSDINETLQELGVKLRILSSVARDGTNQFLQFPYETGFGAHYGFVHPVTLAAYFSGDSDDVRIKRSEYAI